MKQVEYGDTVTPPVGYEGRTWYDKSDPDKKVIDFENYPIVRDTTFVLHRIDGDDDGYCDPIVENNTGTTSLRLKICGNNSGSFYPFKAINDSFFVNFMCNGSLFGYFEKNNTGGITISENIKTKKFVSFFDDDYGILFLMPGLNTWYGDINSSSAVHFTLSPINDQTNTTEISIWRVGNNFDEQERMLLEGMSENKALRIPCDGFSSNIQIIKYPYNLYSEYFYERAKITFFLIENNQVTDHININDEIFDIDGFHGEVTDGDFSIKDRLVYNIEANDTCDYKHYVLCFAQNFIDTTNIHEPMSLFQGTCLHFIQEYNVKNRIYYGRDDYGKFFDDKYRETQSNDYRYHVWFEFCSSKIITNNQWEYTSGNSLEYVAYPNSEDFEYNLTFADGPNILDNNYMWGNKSYTIINNSNNTITFTKK